MKLYVYGPDLVKCLAENEEEAAAARSRPEEARQNAQSWLARYCEARGCEAELFFDDCRPGEVRNPYERAGTVTVYHLPHGEEAWKEIAARAHRSAVRDRTVVVADDIKLIRALARSRVTVTGAEEFVSRARQTMRPEEEALANEPDEKFTGVSEGEVGFWLDFFKRGK